MIDIAIEMYYSTNSFGKVATVCPSVRMTATVGAGWDVDKLETVRQRTEQLLRTELPKCIKGGVAYA